MELPKEFQFVEITDPDGKVGLVVFVQSNLTVSFDADSSEARRYKTLYDVEFIPLKEEPTPKGLPKK